jgi:hypothetical protein
MPDVAIQAAVANMITRELRAIRRELEAYPSASAIWETHPGLPNTAGTLALHAAGNLLHFFGAVYLRTGYVRDRDAEFTRRDVGRAELIRLLGEAGAVVDRTCAVMTEAQWRESFPLAVASRRLQTGEFFLHLATHLAYHLGQIDYHRRVVTGNAKGTGAVSPAELLSAVPAAP